MFMWKEDHLMADYDNSKKDINNFYNEIKNSEKKEKVGLVYRKDQHQFSLDIL